MTSPTPQSRLFEALSKDPVAFEPLTALRIAQTEADIRGLDILVRSDPSGAIAPSGVQAVRVTDTHIEVSAPLIGLVGPLSPLPPAYTELAAADRRRKGGAMAAFFDLFSDRMTQLFAGGATKYNLPEQLQWQPSALNGILQALKALTGFGTAKLDEHKPLDGDTLLQFAGLLAQRGRTAMGLQAIAQSYLGLPVQVAQFQHRWVPMPAEEQSQLDGTAALGQGTMAGSFIPDRAGQCRLVVGPVRYADFLSLEAGQLRLRELAELTRLYLGPVLEFDVQIILDRRDVPQTQLGGDGPAARLGWNTWAKSEPSLADSDEAVIDGHRAMEAAA